jgi:hypothetical protein
VSKYLSLIVAAVGACLVTAQSALSDGDISMPFEGVQIAAAFTGALLVGIAANPDLPVWRHTKAIVLGVDAVLLAWLGEMVNGGAEMSGSGWLNVAIMAGAALSLWPVKNAPTASTGAKIE